MRADHVSNANDHETLRHKKSSNTKSPRDGRRRGNKNTNTEDSLERFCTEVDLRVDFVRSEVEECLNILNRRGNIR